MFYRGGTHLEIKHSENKFTIVKDGEQLGLLSYTLGTEVLTVDHTEVSPKLEGQGMGKKLVEHVVKYARQEGKCIDPKCPFANDIIEKTPEFQDILQ